MSERIEHGPLVIELIQDEDCENPRDWEGHFLWLGFPHRNYEIGDETFDPSESWDCPTCENRMIYPGDEECPDCDEGQISPYDDKGRIDGEKVMERIMREHDARLVVPVGMLDHSGLSFYLGGGAHWSDTAGWDSGTCGFMVATNKALTEWGITDADDAEIRKQMSAELHEYTSWSNGDCWGYQISLNEEGEVSDDDQRDWRYEVANGDTALGLRAWLQHRFLNAHDESCWGFIGYEYALSEATTTADFIIKQMEGK